jgi:sec-independent protein translocase protein TatA
MEFGIGKLLLLLVIIVLVFGTSKLPKIGADLGGAIRSFRKAVKDGENPKT